MRGSHLHIDQCHSLVEQGWGECGTHKGRRDDGIKTMGRWGGQRERKTWENKFIHPDAESGLDEFFV
eukprot:4845032-Ditylum_brightwellii.AAC.1